MAEAPKSTKQTKPADPKAKPAGSAKTPKDPKAKPAVEDAVVIGETPPKPPRPTDDAKTAAGSTAADGSSSKPAATPARPEPAAKPTAQATAAARTMPPSGPDAKATDKPDTSTATGTAAKPAAKPLDPPKPATAAAPSTKPAAAPEPARRGGARSFVGLLLGGVAAAVIGFVAARTVVPEGWPFPGVAPEVDPLVAVVEAQGSTIVALEDRLAALDAGLDAVKSDTSALDALRDSLASRLDGLETGAGDLAAQVAAMETRLSSVEKLAPEGTEAAKAAAEAYGRELSALREMFQGELDQIHAAQADATALEAQLAQSAQAAAGRAALAQVTAALDTGEPFETALGELAAATGVAAPEALGAVAADGVPTLGALQGAFPAAARTAIDAATRAAVEDGSMGRMAAFLQTQLGTRSIEPREGDDADAVLSRAEAALKSGDLDTVLAELDTLPEAARPALADWRAEVEIRAQALAAGRALADELNAK